jgi:hypothetical protein
MEEAQHRPADARHTLRGCCGDAHARYVAKSAPRLGDLTTPGTEDAAAHFSGPRSSRSAFCALTHARRRESSVSR